MVGKGGGGGGGGGAFLTGGMMSCRVGRSVCITNTKMSTKYVSKVTCAHKDEAKRIKNTKRRPWLPKQLGQSHWI